MNDDEATPKKKVDKTVDNITVSLDKGENSKEKSDSEEPKPRIVLTFRSEKSNTKSANMKIVSTEEKHEEVSPRRSSRTRGKWDWVCDSDTPISPKKDKSQPVSENDESDGSHSAAKRSHRRSKDDNIIANAIARKEKLYNEPTPGPTQRLSRRIKPTAKILANEELRMGLEFQNNARLGIQPEKLPEEGVRTRRSARPPVGEKVKAKAPEPVLVELDSDSQNSDMKVQHLCKLGLKAIDPEEVEVEPEEPEEDVESKELEEEEEDELLEDDEETIDDDSEVISKLLEADEDSGDEDDDEFLCAVATSKGKPRRSTRQSGRACSSFEMNDSDHSSTLPDDDSKAPTRRSSRRAGPFDDSDRSHRTRRKRRQSEEDTTLEAECDDESNPAGGEEGSEAACPAEKSTVVAQCYCRAPSNMYASTEDLAEPVFCQAIEIVDGVRVGCSHGARRAGGALGALLRAGPRAPYLLACALHAAQLDSHMCCPACGLFCSQGIFFQCSEGHLFHLECGLPYSDSKSKPGCPHCGVYSYRWQPVNTNCWHVKLEMKSSNKRIFLPDQREQCTPAYLGFSTLCPSQLDSSPVIPEELLPPARDLRQLCGAPDGAAKCTPQEICDAILAGETFEQLMPKIVSGAKLKKRLASQDGGTCVHAAARRGHLPALYLLHRAGAALSAVDNSQRTPLTVAVLALLDKSELKCKDKLKEEKIGDEMEVDKELEPQETSPEAPESKPEAADTPVKDEDLMKVIRYLVAAGADVNLADQPDSMSPLHVAAQHGSMEVCAALLQAADVDVDARDQGGWSPLVWAAENSHHDVVRLLISHGASAASTDNEGNSAIHWCALAGASLCLQLLLHHAPQTASAPDKHTDTPLHIAARQGHYACVVILLARGARTDIENAEGELPIDVCSGQCQNAIALNMHMNLALKDKLQPYKLLSSDISNGREPHPIPCINEVDDAPAPADFTYVTQHVTPEPVSVDCTIQSLQGCRCAAGACGGAEDACACAALGVRGWWRGGRLRPGFPYHDPPMLFQCNQTCGCNPKLCGNSVVSRLSSRGATFARAEVFRWRGGWGLRAAARVPRGAPVAAYCGELLPMQQADARADDSYMFALDVKPDLIEQCMDKTQLCVDACHYGSAARFINHSCRPNLAPVRVFTHTRDLRLPTVTLFATADIAPGDQFTFDYGDKFWAVKSKWMKCECGSADCRYPTRTTEETEA